MSKREFGLARRADPFGFLRQMTSELDRAFGEPGGAFEWFRTRPGFEGTDWFPRVDVFERENRLVTRVDLPGVKKEEVKVEVANGQLTITGERKTDAEEKHEDFYRCERQYGGFYRAVPLPEGVRVEEVKATFADGVLEVTAPLQAKAEATPRRVNVEDAAKPGKAA